MKRLSYLRFGTYVLLLAAIAVVFRHRHFIEFRNFPFMNERFHVDVHEGEEDVWAREFSQRTNGLNHFEAELIARSQLRKMGADDSKLFGGFAVFQRGAKEGVYVVVYPRPIVISRRSLLCVRVTEDRLAHVTFID